MTKFNRTPLAWGPRVDGDYSQDSLWATPNLARASLQAAVLFGGPIVKKCLEIAPIKGDRPFVFVDTKVNMLLPGFIPAIPGWHTDGIPRHEKSYMSDLHKDVEVMSPFNSGNPSLWHQEKFDSTSLRPRFHTIHVGNDCPTQFVDEPLEMRLKHSEDPRLYQEMSMKMTELVDLEATKLLDAIEGQWLSWDWWQIHRAQPATDRGWRLLIRVTESIWPPAERDFIRSQTQVYVPEAFGW